MRVVKALGKPESTCPKSWQYSFATLLLDHFYEEGIQTFETASRFRRLAAFQHWSGNTAYSMYEVIQEMVKRSV